MTRVEVFKLIDELVDAEPEDFIAGVDELVKRQPVSPEMKKGINKMLNVFYTHLNNLPKPEIKNNTFLDYLVKDNEKIVQHTDLLRPLIKTIQQADRSDKLFFDHLKNKIEVLLKVEQHYQVIENVLFPFLEKQWPDHRCFQVLWSVHDDVRKELKELHALTAPINWDLKRFNRLMGDLFFNIRTIIFREERILLPAIINAGLPEPLNHHLPEVNEIGWSFVQMKSHEMKESDLRENIGSSSGTIEFTTGALLPEQIELIFNHLPVDITFVDEYDTVQYFSTPKKRTFPRTNSVIGRKVQNCHPPESVWMVEEILEAFKKNEQDHADFRIPFKDQFVYIQYFAVRDENGAYKGTIEVTQDVKEIRDLEGEKRLLDWNKP